MVLTTRDNALKVHLALKNFGAPLQGLNVEDLATPGWVYQIGMAPIRVDLLTSADGVEFAEAWIRRREVMYGDVSAWVISKQDLIANKLATGRPQDLIDIKSLQEED